MQEPGAYNTGVYQTFGPNGTAVDYRGAGYTKSKSGMTKGGSIAPRPWALYVLPILMFTLISAFITYAFHHSHNLCWMIIVVCAIFSVLMVVLGSAVGELDRSTPILQWLGLLCICAVFMGVVTGFANYSWYMKTYWVIEESREYYNVLPSEPAGAHADAGKIRFADSARIDTTKAVGYKSGHIYCVAPIMDTYSGSRVEFWAVGTDCCKKRSSFSCDDAATADVFGGLVVQDSSFIGQKSNFDFYHLAVKEAQASYDLASASEPLFVRWVADPDALQAQMFVDGTYWLSIFVGFYTLVNLLFAWTTNRFFLSQKR